MWWACALLAVAAARPDPGYRLDRSHLVLESAIYSAPDATLVNPSLRARWLASRRFAVEAHVPVVTRLDELGTSRLGNISVSAWLRGHLLQVGRVELGLLFAAPTASVDGERDLLAVQIAEAMTGYFDVAAYRPDTLSLGLPLRFESTSAEGLAFWGEGRPVLGLPTTTDDPLAVLTLTLGAGYRVQWAEARVEFGMGALFLPERDVEGQLLVEPGLRLRLFSTEQVRVFVDGSLRINMDPPAGFAFDDGFYAAYVRLGAETAPPPRVAAPAATESASRSTAGHGAASVEPTGEP